MFRMLPATVSFALMSLSTIARADVPPPGDYVENCTVEKQTAPGLQCQSCSAWHGERDKCEKSLGTQGYRHMCKSWGASSWDEVWCKGEPSKPADPTVTSGGATTTSSKCQGGGVELVAGVGAALALLIARRRRVLTPD